MESLALHLNMKQLLEHREFLTLLARSLVADPVDQEELLWETMGEGATRSTRLRGAGPASVRFWLARVMRNRAIDRHRAALRQERHAPAAARSEAVESAAEMAARFELGQELARHVQALSPDYRDAVLFRFYEALPPREIARRLGVPVETVKTRLQRALALLRARLDQEHGSREKWLGGLVPLAWPGAEGAVAGASAVGLTTMGVWMMSLKSKALLAGLAALLLVAAGILYAIRDMNEAPGRGAALDTQALVALTNDSAGADGGLQREALESGTPQRREVTEEAHELPAVLTGRCVDAEGKPVEGSGVRLTGRAPASSDADGVDKSSSGWQAPRPDLTGPDGRFEIRSQLAPLWSYSLTLEAAGCVPLTKYWSGQRQWEGVLDLGDIQMLKTCRLYGRVLDAKGRPREGLHVSLERGRSGTGSGYSVSPMPPHWGLAMTSGDGRFEISAGMTQGFWEIHLDEQEEILGNKDFVIKPGQQKAYLEIRIRNAEDFETIHGLVSDRAGVGIDGATVVWPHPDLPESSESVTTDREGRFQIRRTRAMLRDKLALRIQREGYEVLRVEGEFARGGTLLRLVLEEAKSLHVLVKDALTGTPIEAYGYCLKPLGTAQGGDVFRNYGQQAPARDPGMRHPEGLLVIEGLAKGSYDFQIVPQKPYLRSARILLVQPRRGDLEVALTRSVQQVLHVRSMNGQRIAGCRVELLESLYGLPVDFNTWIADSGINSAAANFAVAWTQGETGEDGRVLLTGPPGRELTLRIRAPGHMRKLVQGIALKEDGEGLVVRLQRGATLKGVLGPVELLDRLRKQGRRASRDTGLPLAGFQPGLRLVKEGAGERIPSALDGSVLLEESGAFSIRGIPPGTWRLELVLRRSWRKFMGYELLSIREVANLQDGEVRELSLSLPALVPGEVMGKVTWNGEAVPQAGLVFEKLSDRKRDSRIPIGGVRLNSDGSYSWILSPGRYYCRLDFHRVDGTYLHGIPLGRVLQVLPGARVRLDMDFTAGLLALRLRDAEGRPVPGRRLWVRPVGSPVCDPSPATDGNGRVEWLVPCGAIEILMAPSNLASKAAEARFRKEHAANPAAAWAKVLVSIAKVKVGTEGARKECALPRE